MTRKINIRDLQCPYCRQHGTMTYRVPGTTYGVGIEVAFEPGSGTMNPGGFDWILDPDFIDADRNAAWIECEDHTCKFPGADDKDRATPGDLARAPDPQRYLDEIREARQERQDVRLAVQRKHP